MSDQQPVKMKTSGKSVLKKYVLAIFMIVIGLWLINQSDGQVYGAFIGVVFFIMAITSILDHEYIVKFGTT